MHDDLLICDEVPGHECYSLGIAAVWHNKTDVRNTETKSRYACIVETLC